MPQQEEPPIVPASAIPARADGRRLEAELEQVRVEAEDARSEAAILAAERDSALAQLQRRTIELSRAEERLRLRELAASEVVTKLRGGPNVEAMHGEEELRVALEEAQVLAEELMEANNSLQNLNDDLDRRAAERTAALERANAGLHQIVAQRDLLMQEVHHRVKNSLQLVQGLLLLQARSPRQEAAGALREAALRVRTIAAVHDRLYRAGGGLDVELRIYLSGLIDDLRASVATASEGRDIRLDVPAGVIWPAAAVPARGLAVTELVTNSLKYGAGLVTVSLHPNAEQGSLLWVEDQGRGLPPDFDPAASSGLGMRLIATLLRGVHGRLSVDRSVRHTRFLVRLPVAGKMLAEPDAPAR